MNSIIATLAPTRDWTALTEALTNAFLGLDYYAALEIALTRAHGFIPTWEAHQPEATWAKGLLVWIVSYGLAPANLPQEAGLPHNSPGAANFQQALIDLARGAEKQTPLENRLRFLASAVSQVIVAELAAAWYADHPDAWAEQVERGDEIEPSGLTVRQRIYLDFWYDPVTAERDTAAWLEIAAAVDKKAQPR